MDTATGSVVEQSNACHVRCAALYAKRAVSCVGLGLAAYFTALLHDTGKQKERAKRYLEDAAAGRPVRRGSVNHTFAGTRYILRRWHLSGGASLEDVAAELLAYAAGAHHGLFDCVSDDHKSGFSHRLTEGDSDIDESIQNFIQQCVDEAELDELFAQAFTELQGVFDKLGELNFDNDEIAFCVGMTARLLLSAVIEGDRRNTAEFMQAAMFIDPPEDMRPLWYARLSYMEDKLKLLPLSNPIDTARHRISQQCHEFAVRKAGVYRLSVPTGSGKTLSALRYALAHAGHHNKRRIVFAAPLLSILDQNAAVIRDYVGDDSIILEHHSNVTRENGGEFSDGSELLTDNWEAPIIITTMVQLLNTLFSDKTGAIRRMWALCGSVIVLDEVQSLPVRMLSQFNAAVNFLSEFCDATVVLCSATQPCLEAAVHPLLHVPEEIVPCDKSLWDAFRRTELRYAGNMPLRNIPDFLQNVLANTKSLLVICNKKQQAEYLFRELKREYTNCFHLSASMCQAHRKDTLRILSDYLNKHDEKIICVSTQVIEAGVDISFGSVVRLCAGMDNVVQAAGRCNRNGESDTPSPVYLIRCDDEKLARLQDIQRAKDAATELLVRFARAPEQYDYDLRSDKAIAWYYKKLYAGTASGFQDYTLPRPNNHLTQFSLLSSNEGLADPALCPECDRYFMRQAFKLAGSAFKIFDEDTTDVIVPYGKGAELIAALNSDRAMHDPAYAAKLIKSAGQYAVSLFEYQLKLLEKAGGLHPACGGLVLTLDKGYYDEATGFTMHDKSNGYEEV